MRNVELIHGRLIIRNWKVSKLGSLKDKIEWMLQGGYLTDKGKRMFAYSIDLEKKMFYCTSIRSVKAKNPKRKLFQS